MASIHHDQHLERPIDRGFSSVVGVMNGRVTSRWAMVFRSLPFSEAIQISRSLSTAGPHSLLGMDFSRNLCGKNKQCVKIFGGRNVFYQIALTKSIVMLTQNSRSIKRTFIATYQLRLLRYDLTDTAGVLENKVLGMFHGLDD